MFGRIFGGKKKGSDTNNETLKSLRNNVDRYIGYNQVSNRKQTDEAIRKHYYELILKLIDEFSKVQNKLMQGQMLSTWHASNKIVDMLNELRNLLTTDVYRHSTFFETPDVSDSLDISVLYLLESETILELRDVLDRIKDVNERLSTLELTDIEKDIMQIKNEIEASKTSITDRAELIASFEIVGL